MQAVKISIEEIKFQDYSLQVNFSQLQEDTLLRRYNTLNDICMNNQSNNNYADFNAKLILLDSYALNSCFDGLDQFSIWFHVFAC